MNLEARGFCRFFITRLSVVIRFRFIYGCNCIHRRPLFTVFCWILCCQTFKSVFMDFLSQCRSLRVLWRHCLKRFWPWTAQKYLILNANQVKHVSLVESSSGTECLVGWRHTLTENKLEKLGLVWDMRLTDSTQKWSDEAMNSAVKSDILCHKTWSWPVGEDLIWPWPSDPIEQCSHSQAGIIQKTAGSRLIVQLFT